MDLLQSGLVGVFAVFGGLVAAALLTFANAYSRAATARADYYRALAERARRRT